MDMVDTPKKEIQDMNAMELIEKISKTIKITALNLWTTNRENTNVYINNCAQEMKDIRLLADKSRLQDALNNIEVALRVMETLTEISEKKVVNESAQDIVKMMLDTDDESLTSVSDGYDSCPTCDSDSD